MPEEICKDGRIWGQNNKEAGDHLGVLTGRKRRAYDSEWYQVNKERLHILQRNHRQKRKLETLTHYSAANPPECARCGIDDLDLLCLDHINGDGAKQRRETGLGKTLGKALYFYLKRMGYPEGYQVLCFNCNQKKKVTEDIRK